MFHCFSLVVALLATQVPSNPPTEVPWAAAVRANNRFGVELFKALAEQEPGGNLFISPYSLSIALTMAAEGAREETASEMAQVLHFPSGETRSDRTITPVHEGYARLTKQFLEARGVNDPKTQAEIEDLRSQLEAANANTRELESNESDYQRAQRSQRHAESLASRLNALLATVDRFDLRIANALWVERTYPLSQAYTTEIDRHYGTGAAQGIDFRKDAEGARRHINLWVENQTERRIKDLIPSGVLSDLTRLVIASAIYFKGQWAVPFEEANTKEEPFTKSDGSVTKTRMMNDSWRYSTGYAAFTGAGEFFETPTQVPAKAQPGGPEDPPTYPDDAGFQVIELPYKHCDLAMVFLLPRTAQGLTALEARLDGASLEVWLKRLDQRTVIVGVPRFKLEFEAEMSSALQSLGMRRAFVMPGQPGDAQFSGMTTSSDLLDQPFISAVLHKAWIEVTEKGTEAAAATAVVGAVGSEMPAPPVMVPFIPEFRANRPFLFLLRDTKSGAILFMGRVTNPD